jgi:hypothetical protein
VSVLCPDKQFYINYISTVCFSYCTVLRVSVRRCDYSLISLCVLRDVTFCQLIKVCRCFSKAHTDCTFRAQQSKMRLLEKHVYPVSFWSDISNLVLKFKNSLIYLHIWILSLIFQRNILILFFIVRSVNCSSRQAVCRWHATYGTEEHRNVWGRMKYFIFIWFKLF